MNQHSTFYVNKIPDIVMEKIFLWPEFKLKKLSSISLTKICYATLRNIGGFWQVIDCNPIEKRDDLITEWTVNSHWKRNNISQAIFIFNTLKQIYWNCALHHLELIAKEMKWLDWEIGSIPFSSKWRQTTKTNIGKEYIQTKLNVEYPITWEVAFIIDKGKMKQFF